MAGLVKSIRKILTNKTKVADMLSNRRTALYIGIFVSGMLDNFVGGKHFNININVKYV